MIGAALVLLGLAALPALAGAQAQPRIGVEAVSLSSERVYPGGSVTYTILLKAPAGPGHRMAINAPAFAKPADFAATPGWVVTVPEGQRAVTVTITANPNAAPAFGGPYVDLHPDYDAAAPTRRLTMVPFKP
ncbi:MAG TPA: hypothetical protein VM074_12590 [Solimonas sp.]|nr:hypothetical protein [Solimonas sp.]